MFLNFYLPHFSYILRNKAHEVNCRYTAVDVNMLVLICLPLY